MSGPDEDLKSARKRFEREAMDERRKAGCAMPPSEMNDVQRRTYEAITRRYRRNMERMTTKTFKVPPGKAKFDELIGRAAAIYLSQHADHHEAIARIAAYLAGDDALAPVVSRRLDARVKDEAERFVEERERTRRAAARAVVPAGNYAASAP